jgi:[glutamine synthetase] adenylyltransferase / [glutamine synthetase]-adenylyl-L-tyrosine phosphorylase
LKANVALRRRLCELLGFSQALADTLERQIDLLNFLRREPMSFSRPQLRRMAREAVLFGATSGDKLDALRRFRRAHSLRIGLLDMQGQSGRKESDFRRVVRQISDLAQVVVQIALEVLSEEFDTRGFAVLAMGKLGARELNYWSDIDLMFLSEGENNRALGEALLKTLTDSTASGMLYRVDMRLRPEGSSGPLVTPLGYALSYYESFAAAWEWQALIKCRVIAGDARLARRFRRFTQGVTWARRADDAHLRAVVEMKKRSEATPEGSDATNVKQGPGAIRDAEWVVQQLQMMVGPSHKRARVPDTLGAIRALHEFGALTDREARELREGYIFLRVVEHRLQLLDERAVRTLPPDEHERAALARRLGYRVRTQSAAQRMEEDLLRHRKEIRALCERLFWGWQDAEAGSRPQEAGSETPTDHSPLTTHPNAQRLQRIAHGSSTRPFPAPLARQIEAALPAVLRHLEHAAEPERALGNLERLCEASGNRLSLLRALGEAPAFARAVAAILGGASFVADTLISQPELLDMAAQRTMIAEAKKWDAARSDCRSYCLTFRDRQAAVRRWKKREMLRIALRDLALDSPPHEITGEIADLARACLSLAVEETGVALRPVSDMVRFAVLGMGKLGGGEMHYASDCDVIFVYQAPSPWDGAGPAAARWAEELMRWMGERTEEGACFELDARLRPHGSSGALVPSVAAFHDYFENPGGIAIWERQALTRARYAAGDAEIGAALLLAARHVAFPEVWRDGWSDELRHIKTRVENERGAKSAKAAGRGTGELFDVKLGHGALSDIEWCAQWLALKFGARFSHLQTPNTRAQIQAAHQADLLSHTEAAALLDAHTFLRRAELRLQLTQDHGGHAARSGSREFRAWARAVFPDETTAVAADRFAAEWHQFTNASRAVMERVRDEM